MTWDTFKGYFDPHTWIQFPSMRAEGCLTCPAIIFELEALKMAQAAWDKGQ